MTIPKDVETLIEEQAEREHNQWMEWSKVVASEVSSERRARWEKLWVPYSELSEEAKDRDREYAEPLRAALQSYALHLAGKLEQPQGEPAVTDYYWGFQEALKESRAAILQAAGITNEV